MSRWPRNVDRLEQSECPVICVVLARTLRWWTHQLTSIRLDFQSAIPRSLKAAIEISAMTPPPGGWRWFNKPFPTNPSLIPVVPKGSRDLHFTMKDFWRTNPLPCSIPILHYWAFAPDLPFSFLLLSFLYLLLFRILAIDLLMLKYHIISTFTSKTA